MSHNTDDLNQDRAKLSTLALEFSSVLDRMPALKTEMNAFLAPNQALDYAGLVRRLEPALEQAAEFILELDFLSDAMKEHEAIQNFTKTATTRMGFRMVGSLMQRLNEAKQEASHAVSQAQEVASVASIAALAAIVEVPEPLNTDWTIGNTAEDVCGRYGDVSLKGVNQRFRWIPEGSFLMGSPITEPERSSNEEQHLVTFEKGFWMADTTCTQALWTAIMGNNPAKFKANPKNPVEQVSWNDAQLFLQRLNELVPSMVFRLPSEAEWEYACRAGSHTVFSFGNTITTAQANYDGRFAYNNGARGIFRQETVPVKTFAPNDHGLYQMHCNVWEWCEDAYGNYTSTPTDGTPWLLGDGGLRVVRGGSWNDYPSYLRCAFRNRYSPDFRYYDVGFRIVCTAAPLHALHLEDDNE